MTLHKVAIFASFPAGLLLLAATAAQAQPGGTGQPPSPPGPGGRMIFISPAGEPFRASTGDYPSQTWFDQADSNHDKRLTALEMITSGDAFFRQLDQNGDGRIGGEEVRRYETSVAPEIRVSPGPAGDGAGPPAGLPSSGGVRGPGGDQPPGIPSGGPDGGGAPDSRMSRPRPGQEMPRGGGRFSFFSIAHPILRADTDLSGSITLDEFRAWQRQQFVALDAQKKGFVTFDELPQTPAQSRHFKLGKRRKMRQ